MRWPEHPGLRRGVRRIVQGFAGGAIVLLYHRISDEPDCFRNSVTPKNFAAHLEIIRKYTNPVSLQDVVTAAGSGSGVRSGVVITFDDGYADVYETALPLLRRFEVPATVYVVAGMAGADQEFWWDELEFAAGHLSSERAGLIMSLYYNKFKIAEPRERQRLRSELLRDTGAVLRRRLSRRLLSRDELIA
jgi:hypothetical protein